VLWAFAVAVLLLGHDEKSLLASEFFREGAMLTKAPRAQRSTGRTMRVDLRSGVGVVLPQSAYARNRSESPDIWSASTSYTSNLELVRVDRAYNVDIFDPSGKERVAGFSLRSLPGVHQPSLQGPVKPSPDGRYLLTYWKKTFRQRAAEIVVFDRTGRIVESGSPYKYERQGYMNSFDWLPDGSYVYLAGSRIVLSAIGSERVKTPELHLPRNVKADGTLSVSPDGTRIALSLPVLQKDQSGFDATYNFLFTANLDGSALQQLTTLSRSAIDSNLRIGHGGPSWSPDGKWIAFGARVKGGASPYFGVECSPVIVVASDARLVPIDGWKEPESRYIHFTDPQSGIRRRLDCGALWLKG